MKQFSCGDVVPGCQARFVCSTEEDLMAEVAAHARVDHGMDHVPDEVVNDVRRNIQLVG